jgi:hypothetical protein
MRPLLDKIEQVGKLFGCEGERFAPLLKNPAGSPVRVRRARKETMAAVANSVGFFHGVVRERHFFVTAIETEKMATASAIVTVKPRKLQLAGGIHANFRESVR